jgi:hypothetical protein
MGSHNFRQKNLGNNVFLCNFSNFRPRWVGFSDGNDGFFDSTNSYAIRRNDSSYNEYWLSGKQHKVEHPVALAVRDVVGSGLLLKSTNELAVFFTLNGKLLGKLLATQN